MFLADLKPPITAGRAWESGIVNLSVADAIVVVLMIAVFVIAILIPLSGGKR